MKLLIQPEGGVAPILTAIKGAKKSVEIIIFRFDRREIEAALKAAAGRGVFVHALIAYANRGGEQHLRQLEMRFLEFGVTVARTGDDLIRYHDKMLLIDRRMLYVFSFNYTSLDIDHSRGFGIITENRAMVQEAARLFEADTKRQPYTPRLATFVVSPLNARKQIGAFLRKAREELLIYDPKIADTEMIRLIQERARAGVDVKILGRIGKRAAGLAVRKLGNFRLHTRTIIRDGKQAFVGSQSLRKVELDARRELGLIVKDANVVRGLMTTFESDWEANAASAQDKQASPSDKELQKKVKVVAKELPPLATAVKKAVRRVVEKAGEEAFSDDKVKQTVKKAVKKAVKEAVKEVADQAANA